MNLLSLYRLPLPPFLMSPCATTSQGGKKSKQSLLQSPLFLFVLFENNHLALQPPQRGFICNVSLPTELDPQCDLKHLGH
jgi:hypothetical protein